MGFVADAVGSVVEGITGSDFLGEVASFAVNVYTGNYAGAGADFVDIVSGEEMDENEQQLAELAKENGPEIADAIGSAL